MAPPDSKMDLETLISTHLKDEDIIHRPVRACTGRARAEGSMGVSAALVLGGSSEREIGGVMILDLAKLRDYRMAHNTRVYTHPAHCCAKKSVTTCG